MAAIRPLSGADREIDAYCICSMSLAKLNQENLLWHQLAAIGRGNSRSSKQPTGTPSLPGRISGYQNIVPPQFGQKWRVTFRPDSETRV